MLTADCCLVYLHVAVTGVNGNRGTAAAHFANHTLPRLLNAALDGRCHRMAQRDASGIRGDVDVKGGVGWHAQGHVSRAVMNIPQILGHAVSVNVTAARLGMKSAIDAVCGNVAGSGADFNVARTPFLDFDVTATRFDLRRTRKLAPANISRARLETQFTGKTRQFQIARPALEINIALEPFDILITAAGMSTNRGVLRDGDFVINGNVVEVDVVDADAVAVLANRRIVLQPLHLLFVVAAEPGIARVDLGVNRNRARSAVPDSDVAGASKHLEIDRTINLE